MTRFVVITILLGVFFFGGMTYGNVDKQSVTVNQSEVTELETEVIEHVDINPYESEVIQFDHDRHKINKTANFFEKVVNSFYDVIITILYSIAGLFFD